MQTWSVTPSGVVVITAVLTYWTPTGTIDKPRVFLADLPYPAALIPQSAGPLTRLQGATSPDGTFSIPHVPGGFYWLQLSPSANYWTSTSAFDAGGDFIGNPIQSGTSSGTTTLNVSLTNADPIQAGDYFSMSGNAQGFPQLSIGGYTGLFGSGSTTVNFSLPLSSTIDYSNVNTLFFRQYEPVSAGGFSGTVLGPSLTQSNVTITNGAANSVGGALSPSPQSSVSLSIKGSAWSDAFQNSAPTSPTQQLSDYSIYVQPFVPNRLAAPGGLLATRNLILLEPTAISPLGGSILSGDALNLCGESSGPNSFPLPIPGPAPILSDQDYGSISYGDPYPADWLRVFQYCQLATVQIPRPNSTATDQFLLALNETTALPTAPVAPLIGVVQSPTVNGTSLFQTASLNTTTLNLSWMPPPGAAAIGYTVQVLQLGTLPSGNTGYLPAGGYVTAKNSLTVPFITAGNTYAFLITATVNAGANVETSPFRSQLPIGHSTVLSAPITINPGTTAN